jgi:hypothetical protein
MRSRGFPAEPNGAGSRPSGRADGGANLGIALQGVASPLPLVDQRVLRRLGNPSRSSAYKASAVAGRLAAAAARSTLACSSAHRAELNRAPDSAASCRRFR